MNESTPNFAPRWLCTVAACLWIFPFTFLSCLFINNTKFSFFLSLNYFYIFLDSFFKASASSNDFDNFPGWFSTQVIAIVPFLISVHFLFADVSIHFSPSILFFLIIFLVWYFFLGQLPLIFLYPISKFCVKVASKIYFSKNIILKLLSSFLVVALCFIFSLAVFSDIPFQNTALGSITISSVSEEPRQGEEVSKESETVWIPTHGGTKYHRRSTCSGMENPEKTTKEDAIRRGFEPCQRCY